MSSSSPITFTDLGFDWPDGSPAVDGLSATFGHGRTGLVGRNGCGKTTLLRLIAGELEPVRGSLGVGGEVAHLPQRLVADPRSSVADLLGVGEKLLAWRRIAAGSIEVTDYELLGDDWDLEARCEQALSSVGLATMGLERRVSTLSGGEAMLVAIVGVRLREVPIVLLDEPTNNLDATARLHLQNLIRTWSGTLLLASHDPVLLEQVDVIAELDAGSLTLTGGGFSRWREQRAADQQAAERAVRDAEQLLRMEKRKRIQAETKLARSRKAGERDVANKRAPKIVLNARRNRAQGSAGRIRGTLDDRVAAATDALGESSARVRREEPIIVDLPDPGVPSSRRLAELIGVDSRVLIQGPQRIALTGPNGVGKTCLLETLVRPDPVRRLPAYGIAHARIGYLPQRLDDLADGLDAIDNLRQLLPGATVQQVRDRLARFLLRGPVVERPVGSLSGGERFRVSLAGILLAEPPAQLLVLDEPTNNLDLDSVDQLIDALSRYRGGLLVVSHDQSFLARLGIERYLTLDGAGRLREVNA